MANEPGSRARLINRDDFRRGYVHGVACGVEAKVKEDFHIPAADVANVLREVSDDLITRAKKLREKP